jgi:electron transfer flavoprotein beta subunit
MMIRTRRGRCSPDSWIGPRPLSRRKIEFIEPRRLRVARETDRGLETVVIRLPAVITTDLRLNEPRYASLPALMKAKKRPIEQVPAANSGCHAEPKLRVTRLEPVAVNRECVRVGRRR